MAPPNSWPQWACIEVSQLRTRGITVELVEVGGQCYARVNGVTAPSPPWDRGAYDILIALPLAAGSALDAFYLGLPYQYSGSTHRRVCGTVIVFEGRNWQLVSWHYPDGRPWSLGKDDLDSHITHCKGFFFNRGAVNAIA
jgi:hypothetical protein